MRNAGKLRKDRRKLVINGCTDGSDDFTMNETTVTFTKKPTEKDIFRPPTELSPLCPVCSSKVHRSLLQERFSCSVCGWLEAIQ